MTQLSCRHSHQLGKYHLGPKGASQHLRVTEMFKVLQQVKMAKSKKQYSAMI